MKGMRLILLAVTGMFLATSGVNAKELDGPTFDAHKLVIGIDVSKNVSSCERLREAELEKVRELLSPTSLTNGNVREVEVFTYGRSIYEKVIVRPKSRVLTRSYFRRLSKEALAKVEELLKKGLKEGKNDYSDVFGALKYAFDEARGKESAYVALFGYGIQNYNRKGLLKEGLKLNVPSNVDMVYLFAEPYACVNGSETTKELYWNKLVRSYWSKLVVPSSKLVIER